MGKTITITDNLLKVLSNRSDVMKLSKVEILRQAIGIYEYLINEISNNDSTVIVRNNSTNKEKELEFTNLLAGTPVGEKIKKRVKK